MKGKSKKGKERSWNKLYLVIVITLILFLSLRMYHLEERLGFGSDEGRDFLVARDIYTSRQPTLIGPPSEYTVNGRQFYFGPAPYYLILPALILGNWDPLVVSYFLIFLNAAILLYVIFIVYRHAQDKIAANFFALIMCCTPVLVTYARSYWNPHFMLPTSLVVLALILQSKTSKHLLLLFTSIGVLSGLGMQFHYSFVFAIVVSIVWLLVDKKISPITLTCLIGGFIIGFFPIILFELRNNFYNSHTLLLVLSTLGKGNTLFSFHAFYLISLLPFIIYFLSLFIAKMYTQYPLFVGIVMLVSCSFSSIKIFTQSEYILNYMKLKEITATIVSDNPRHFNIVDQMTSDNRALALRYLLTVHGKQPLGVTEYPQAKTLYIYSEAPLKNLLVHPVWEIASFQPFTKVETRKFGENVWLYRLEK